MGRPRKYKKKANMTMTLEEATKKKLVKKYGSAQAALEHALTCLEHVSGEQYPISKGEA